MLNFMKSLSKIESSGLNTPEGLEYSYYNPFTMTGRPSNTFNKVNYASLNNLVKRKNGLTS